MISLLSIKLSWHFIIYLCILLQILLLYNQHLKLTKNHDVESAIRRAKTDICKNELSQYVKHYVTNDDDSGLRTKLTRSCPQDHNNTKRNIKVGCMPNKIPSISRIEEQVVSVAECLDICFSYGHSHGGFNSKSDSCFCGDDVDLLYLTGKEENCSTLEEFDWYKVNVGIFNPKKSGSRCYDRNLMQLGKVKILFLLAMRGRAVSHIERLFKHIYSESHLYYFHVDKRDNYLHERLIHLHASYKNVFLANSRYSTIWGSPSLLTMMIDTMKQLNHLKWDYMINLSETDFPLRPIPDLEQYLSLNPGAIYLKSHNIKGYKFIQKQGLDRNFHQCDDHVWRMGKRQLPLGIVYSGGSDWVVLPRIFCDYIVNNSVKTKSLVKSLLQIYENTLLPAESFFHTLALNSKFCDRYVDNNLRLINWQRKLGCKCQHKDVVDWCGCSPSVYRRSDWDRLHISSRLGGHFFARKFDPTISSSIINLVENELILSSLLGTSAKSYVTDTRFWYNLYQTDDYDQSSTVMNENIVDIGNLDHKSHFMEQFGLFTLDQVMYKIDSNRLDLKLETVEVYHNQDALVGLIFRYCDKMERCYEMLMDKQKTNRSRIQVLKPGCESLGGRSLKKILVHHGFDASEKEFRDFRPLHRGSNLIVYHEWLVKPSNRTVEQQNVTSQGDEKMQFILIDPLERVALIQNVKLRETSKLTRVSLAHRLNTENKVLASGQWTIVISISGINCIEYKFIVFDQSSYIDKKIKQSNFNDIHKVTSLCYSKPPRRIEDSNLDADGLLVSSCCDQHWSPQSKAAECRQ